jgi:hypothetical protein
VATVEYNISSFSLHGTRPVSGRVFAVHDPWGRSGCGVATRSYRQAARAALRPYPGQLDGGTIRASKMSGTIYFEVSSGSASLSVKGLISGLAPNSAGGWHVHTGYTCERAADVGGHLFTPGGDDPWASLAYITTISSVPYNLTHTARVDATVGGFTLSGGGVSDHARERQAPQGQAASQSFGTRADRESGEAEVPNVAPVVSRRVNGAVDVYA